MRQIKNFNNYVVDEYGNVYNSSRKMQPLAMWRENNSGYWLVRLYKDGKPTCFRVHRLVAEAFLPNPLALPFVKHKDDNKSNNIVSNLEWGDNASNVKEGYENGCYLYNARSYRISITCNETNQVSFYPSLREAEKTTGISRKSLSAILKGTRKQLPNVTVKYES